MVPARRPTNADLRTTNREQVILSNFRHWKRHFASRRDSSSSSSSSASAAPGRTCVSPMQRRTETCAARPAINGRARRSRLRDRERLYNVTTQISRIGHERGPLRRPALAARSRPSPRRIRKEHYGTRGGTGPGPGPGTARVADVVYAGRSVPTQTISTTRNATTLSP